MKNYGPFCIEPLPELSLKYPPLLDFICIILKFCFITQILGQDDHGYGSEHSKVDPAKKKMTLNSRNVSLASSISFLIR